MDRLPDRVLVRVFEFIPWLQRIRSTATVSHRCHCISQFCRKYVNENNALVTIRTRNSDEICDQEEEGSMEERRLVNREIVKGEERVKLNVELETDNKSDLSQLERLLTRIAVDELKLQCGMWTPERLHMIANYVGDSLTRITLFDVRFNGVHKAQWIKIWNRLLHVHTLVVQHCQFNGHNESTTDEFLTALVQTRGRTTHLRELQVNCCIPTLTDNTIKAIMQREGVILKQLRHISMNKACLSSEVVASFIEQLATDCHCHGKIDEKTATASFYDCGLDYRRVNELCSNGKMTRVDTEGNALPQQVFRTVYKCIQNEPYNERECRLRSEKKKCCDEDLLVVMRKFN